MKSTVAISIITRLTHRFLRSFVTIEESRAEDSTTRVRIGKLECLADSSRTVFLHPSRDPSSRSSSFVSAGETAGISVRRDALSQNAVCTHLRPKAAESCPPSTSLATRVRIRSGNLPLGNFREINFPVVRRNEAQSREKCCATPSRRRNRGISPFAELYREDRSPCERDDDTPAGRITRVYLSCQPCIYLHPVYIEPRVIRSLGARFTRIINLLGSSYRN